MRVVFRLAWPNSAATFSRETPAPEPAWLRRLDRRARRVVAFLESEGEIRSADVARLLGIGRRQARNLLRRWVADDWLEVVDPANRSRRYRLQSDSHLRR